MFEKLLHITVKLSLHCRAAKDKAKAKKAEKRSVKVCTVLRLREFLRESFELFT